MIFSSRFLTVKVNALLALSEGPVLSAKYSHTKEVNRGHMQMLVLNSSARGILVKE